MNSGDILLPSPRLPLTILVGILICAPAIAIAGTETVLHAFDPLPNGSTPQAALTRDSAGNLYRTTVYGGNHAYGTFFKLAPRPNRKWQYTVLYICQAGRPL